MKKVTALGALGLAAALLGLQVILGLEYTAGGTLGTQVGMVMAMVTLAALPVFIEAARRYGHPLLSWALVVPFMAFLAYSLPATTGRTGEIKETKVVDQAKALEDKARVTVDHAKTMRLVDEANSWQIKACKGGNGKDCKAATFILNQRTASLEKLTKQLDEMKQAPAGDLGSDLWAWATGADAATVRKVSVLAFAIGMDFAIWALIWLATSLLTAPIRSANDNLQTSYAIPEPLPPATALPPSLVGAEIIPWSKAFEARHGRKPRWDEVRQAFPDVSKATAWRRVQAA